MEADIFQARIKEAYKKKQFLKIIFQYPSSQRAIVKRGYVTGVGEFGFNFDEVIDGEVTYSYAYIVEIKEEGR